MQEDNAIKSDRAHSELSNEVKQDDSDARMKEYKAQLSSLKSQVTEKQNTLVQLQSEVRSMITEQNGVSYKDYKI